MNKRDDFIKIIININEKLKRVEEGINWTVDPRLYCGESAENYFDFTDIPAIGDIVTINYKGISGTLGCESLYSYGLVLSIKKKKMQ